MNAIATVKPVFQTWKTIKLGTSLKTADDFRNAFKYAGVKIDDRANDALGQSIFTVSAEEMEVELVVVSKTELGFKTETESVRSKEIYARAEEFGLKLCSSEVAPQLLLQGFGKPVFGNKLIVAMKPIAISNGKAQTFHVVKDSDSVGGYSLTSYDGFADRQSFTEHYFLFLRCK